MHTDKNRVLEIINELWQTVGSVKASDFNHEIAADPEALTRVERKHEEVTLGVTDGSTTLTTLGFISTITALLAGKRLAAVINPDTGNIIGWQWYEDLMAAVPEKVQSIVKGQAGVQPEAQGDPETNQTATGAQTAQGNQGSPVSDEPAGSGEADPGQPDPEAEKTE